jgi:phage repressor protein C with HTH and peptisase S24 domain
MIDRAQREIPVRSKTTTGRSPVYALLDDGHARVKRIERPSADQVMLLSDNPDVGPELAQTQTLSIIGKVVWWGHTSKE